MQTLPPELKGRKVSETFMAYVEPYLIDIMSDGSIQTSEQIEVALRLPWSVWNAIQFDKKNNNEIIKYMDLLINQMPIQGKKIMKYLKERKEKYFSQYDYLLGEYSVFFDIKSQEVKLRIEARTNG